MVTSSSSVARSRRRAVSPRAGVLLAAVALLLATLVPASSTTAIPHPPGIGPYRHVLLFGDNEGLRTTHPPGR